MANDPNSSASAASSVPGTEGEPTGPGASSSDSKTAEPERGAGEDLAAGLDLMMRAAKKALKNIEPNRIEELGKRAMRTVENLDRKKVSDFGKKAAKNLDPRKIEEVAEDAGRELLGVIERVAERVEDMIGGRAGAAKSAPPSADNHAEGKPRVRVDDGSSN